jgi:hypothetical protein
LLTGSALWDRRRCHHDIRIDGAVGSEALPGIVALVIGSMVVAALAGVYGLVSGAIAV